MASNEMSITINDNTAALAHYGDDCGLPFELLKQNLDNSTPIVRARKIQKLVEKMLSFNYDSKFISDYINRLKVIPVQVNLCHKLVFLQNMGRTCCVQKLF